MNLKITTNKMFPKGFTLIELLVVVLIIGILAAVAVPQYQKAVEKSRLAEALVNIDTIVKNVDLYILEHGNDDNSGWTDHNNWMTDLSGGTWVEDYYITKYFMYGIDDLTTITAYRCPNTCENSVNYTNVPYELSQGYNFDGGSKYCVGHNALGKYICKSLTAQGWADDSSYDNDDE